MRTRAQASRDAALRRLTRVNHSLALAAVVGAGVVTDVVANTPSGHARTITTTGETIGTGRTVLLTSPESSPTRKPRAHRHHAAAHHHATAASGAAADPPAASGSGGSSQSLQSSPAPTVQQPQPAAQQPQPAAQQPQPAAQQPQPAVQQPQPAPQPAAQPAPQPTVVAVSGGS